MLYLYLVLLHVLKQISSFFIAQKTSVYHLLEYISWWRLEYYFNFFVQLGVFSSQVFQESPRDKIWRRKHCNLVFFHIEFVPMLFLCCTLGPCCFFIVVISVSLSAAPIYEMDKHCNIEIAAQVSRVSSTQNGKFTWHIIFFLLYFIFFYDLIYV